MRRFDTARALAIQTRLVLGGDRQQRVFVKAYSSTDRELLNSYRLRLDRERTCLQALNGLAVPAVVMLPRAQLAPFLPRFPTAVLVQSFAGDRDLHQMRLDREEIVGTWMFLLEQLCAFRRLGILYADMNCGSVIGSGAPQTLKVVDFGIASAVPRRRTVRFELGHLPGMAAPEVIRGDAHSERTLVFHLAWLLGHLLSGHASERNAIRRSLARLPVRLRGVVRRCLADRADSRPENYEAVLAAAASALPEGRARRYWLSARAPYAGRLETLGLRS